MENEGTVKEMWDKIEKAISNRHPLLVIAQTLRDGSSLGKDNARCEDRRVTIQIDVGCVVPVVTGTDGDGHLLTTPETTPWEVTLWHELVGHGILGHDHQWDRVNSDSSNPTGMPSRGGGKIPDGAVAEENEARRRYNDIHPDANIRMRRPTYFDITESEAKAMEKARQKELEKQQKANRRKK